MAFVQRALSFQFQLGTGSFGDSGGSNSTTISNVRASVRIEKNGVPAMNRASIRIWGLTASKMNQLSRIGLVPTVIRNNTVTVTAGDSGGNMSLAFAGGIQDAWPDFSNAPEVSLNVIAFTGMLAQMKPIAPSSYPGSTDVADIMKDLAGKMGYTLENNGVKVQLSSPYLPGTTRMQALAAAEAADIYVVFDDDNGIMAILPKNSARSGSAPILDPTNGTLIGYPSYRGQGQVGLQCLYNPAIRFMGNVTVQNSVVDGANGTWRVTTLAHNLESQIPDGAWFSEIIGNKPLAQADS
jgi:baseplate hub protein gp41